MKSGRVVTITAISMVILLTGGFALSVAADPQENAATATTTQAETDDVTLKPEVGRRQLSPNTNYPDAISLRLVDAKGNGVARTVHAIVHSGDAQLYVAGKALTKELELKTDSSGNARFSLVTGQSTSLELLIVPYAGTTPLVARSAVVPVTVGPRYRDAFSSRRAYYQLFLGQTFANDYDANGKNTGFGNAGQLTRLTFDTMWKRPPMWVLTSAVPPEKRSSGLHHTEVSMEFSKFPFGSVPVTPAAAATATGGEANGTALENAFSGTVGYAYQPDRWASYSPTSNSDLPFDAVRFGVFSRAGITTRAQKSPDGNTSINRIQFGVRFTHHQTKAATAPDEVDNYVPIRFVEISYERFSDFAGVPHANRLVVDGGIRLTPLSNNVLPFYAGIHVNTGKGQDDVRVFVGVLMKLDKLAELIKNDSTGEAP